MSASRLEQQIDALMRQRVEIDAKIARLQHLHRMRAYNPSVDELLLLKAAREMLSEEREFVYFIQCEDDLGPIKIGMSLDVHQRLRALQACNPYPLRVLTVISGGRLVEEALHRRFAKFRRNGEWFDYSAELRGFVVALVEFQHAQRAA